MRSVVVVLPASIWAMIPMLRVLSKGTNLGTILTLLYHRKWAKALLASAILCTSSRFFTADPRLLEASRNSPASRSCMSDQAKLRSWGFLSYAALQTPGFD